tara:strand:- start:2484 stop:2933 length:450 start_codon:yes stop_codon:yes gene_type:complete
MSSENAIKLAKKWFYESFDDDLLQSMEREGLIQAEGFSMSVIATLELDIEDEFKALQTELDAANARIAELAGELQFFVDRVDSGVARSVTTYERFKAVLAKTPTQSLARIQADAIRDAANTMCPVSGHVVRSEQARCDLMGWADVVEKG